jgi:hypothetical protein
MKTGRVCRLRGCATSKIVHTLGVCTYSQGVYLIPSKRVIQIRRRIPLGNIICMEQSRLLTHVTCVSEVKSVKVIG